MFVSYNTFGQTYLGAVAGYDYLLMTTNQKNHVYSVILKDDDKNWHSPSFTYGIRLEQQLVNSLLLSLQGNYTKKEISIYYHGIIPQINKVQFNTYRTSIQVKWLPIKNSYIGLGINCDYIPYFTKSYQEIEGYNSFFVSEEGVRKEKHNRKDIGGIISLGYTFKGFFAELYYIHGFTIKGDLGLKAINPAKSCGINIGYRLKLFDKLKFNGKKANCPKL